MSKVTLEHIAKDSGFSISTVSRVLNDSSKISEQTKKEVFKSADKLDYPNIHRNNKKGKEKIINVTMLVTGFHIGEFYASFYKGYTSIAEHYDILFSIVNTQRSKEELFNLAKYLSEKNDGIILFTPEYHRRDYIELKKKLPANYPVVCNGLIENPVFSTITFDGYSGGHLAANYFLNRGYENCGVIKGPIHKTESRYRYNGFKDFLQQHSTKIMWEYNGDFTFQSGIDAFKSYQKLDIRPRAIFACNDAMCHAFMEAATKAGYHFPDDIAIIGFDNLPICCHHQPTISSISTDYERLASVTVETLLQNMLHPEKQEGMLSLVPVSLVKRESS